jgi:hypothetical protein
VVKSQISLADIELSGHVDPHWMNTSELGFITEHVDPLVYLALLGFVSSWSILKNHLKNEYGRKTSIYEPDKTIITVTQPWQG